MFDEINDEEEGSQPKAMTCAYCRRKLALGADVIALEEGVVGPRGFVPLEDVRLFCSHDCVCGHDGADTIQKLPRRIP